MMGGRPRWCSTLLILLLLCGPRSAGGTVWLSRTLEALSTQASAVLQGRILSVRPEWAPGGRRIDSLVTVAVDGYLKGDLGPIVRLWVPGGQVGRYRSILIGAPVFSEGEEVVLFLGTPGGAALQILGLRQGVFRIVTREPDGQRLVLPPLPPAGGSGDRIVRGDPRLRPVPLDELRLRVRQALDESPAVQAREAGR